MARKKVKMSSRKRQMDVYLMVGALILMFVVLPVSLWMANGFNTFLRGSTEYTQVENTTAFYTGPILNGKTTELRYASVNDTTITAETPTWDVSDEWDQVTLVTTGTNAKMIFNWNVSVNDLMNSKIGQFRIKLNTSKELKVTINAVKFDDSTLTSVKATEFTHVGEDNSTLYWNITPSDILNLENKLNPTATDEVYFQIIIQGYDSDNKLTTGDTIKFQFAKGLPSNAYSFTQWQILTSFASIFGIILTLVAFGSTSYWDPFSKKSRA